MNKLKELQQLTVFHQVVESGSFSKAAEQLHIAKSSVSKIIDALEKRLNVILIQRSTRQLTITDEGLSLHRHTQKISAELDQAQETTADFHSLPQGLLRVSMPPFFGQCQVVPLLPEFRRRFPEVSLELVMTDEYSGLIEEGIDVSIRMRDLPDSTLVAQHLCDIQVICCAAPAYLERAGRPDKLSDLNHHECLVWRPQDKAPADHWWLHRTGQKEQVRVTGKLIANDHLTLKSLALAAQGVAVLPIYAIENELAAGQLVNLFPEYDGGQFPISIVYPKRQRVPVRTRVFVHYLKEAFRAC